MLQEFCRIGSMMCKAMDLFLDVHEMLKFEFFSKTISPLKITIGHSIEINGENPKVISCLFRNFLDTLWIPENYDITSAVTNQWLATIVCPLCILQILKREVLIACASEQVSL